jgi:1A family penicillin-binding protein
MAKPLLDPELRKRTEEKLSRYSKSFEAQTAKVIPWVDAAAQDVWRGVRLAFAKVTSKPARKFYQVVIAGGILGGGIVALLVAGSTYAVYANDLSNPSVLLNKKNVGTTILDRNGEVLYRTYGASHRELVKIDAVPQHLVKATLAAEDPDFYQHRGVSWRATARAAVHDIANRSVEQGGSTITMQLVKNALLSHDKAFTRKYQEVLLSVELERRYSKDEIMQMYLNEVYYGQGSHGIESACHTYFPHRVGADDGCAKNMSLGESALMAGLPLAPSRFDPNIDMEAAVGRRGYVLSRMRELGYITPEEEAAAKAEPIVAAARQVEIKAPHFVFYVLEELRAKYGDELVEQGGITVYTTLDLKKQEIGERIVREHISRLRANRISNGSLVALDPSSGEILTMVGSVDFNQPGFGKVNVATARRQPGSSFKPFAYAAAFKKGWNGATRVDDKPIELPGGDGTIYKPKNYDGTFQGSVLLREALGNSLNIPAIHVIQHAGLQSTIQTARDLGITTLDNESRYGVSLVLGGGEVKLIDMAQAYGTFANGGTRVDTKAILRVLDRNEKDITQQAPKSTKQALDPRIAYMITDILSDNNARMNKFGPRSPLVLSRPAAVKTGTTNDFRDNYTVGYTAEPLVAAVWVGNNDNTPMAGVSGITGAAPIWNRYMEEVLAGQPVKNFNRPAGLVEQTVCTKDGGLANPWDRGVKELFLQEAQQTRRCASEAPKPKEEEKKEDESNNPRNEEPKPPKPDEDEEEPDETPAPSPAPTTNRPRPSP